MRVVARRLSYSPYNRLLEGLRSRLGVRIIYQDESPREAMEHLKSGGILGILPDQDIKGLSGIFVDFFGRPAWTPVGPAWLSMRTGAPLVPFFWVWDRGKYRGIVHEPLPIPNSGNRQLDIERLTSAWSRILEEEIRRRPDQWAWFHRRWRRRPSRTDESSGGSACPSLSEEQTPEN